MDLDLDLSSGRVRAHRWGDEGDPLVICVHGLTANLTGFSWLAEGLVRRGYQVVAFDCRGRGRSEVTEPGTYGLEAHSRDVLELVGQLGQEKFSYVGWSMGALIGMLLADSGAAQMERLVLLDHVGPMEPAAIALVEASLQRLDAEVPTPEHYLEAIRSRGIIDPWTPFWSTHYGYELVPDGPTSWSPSTDRGACAEDLEEAGRDWSPLWPRLSIPTTLVRATAPIAGALIVTDEAVDAFRAAAPTARVVETPTNHYTVMTDPAMLAAVISGLEAEPGR